MGSLMPLTHLFFLISLITCTSLTAFGEEEERPSYCHTMDPPIVGVKPETFSSLMEAMHGRPKRPEESMITDIRRMIGWSAVCDESEQFSDEVVWEAYRFFRDAVAFKPAIYFQHVSKAGGTSVCEMATANECHDPNYHPGKTGFNQGDNCWSRVFRDGPRWINHTNNQDEYKNGYYSDL